LDKASFGIQLDIVTIFDLRASAKKSQRAAIAQMAIELLSPWNAWKAYGQCAPLSPREYRSLSDKR